MLLRLLVPALPRKVRRTPLSLFSLGAAAVGAAAEEVVGCDGAARGDGSPDAGAGSFFLPRWKERLRRIDLPAALTPAPMLLLGEEVSPAAEELVAAVVGAATGASAGFFFCREKDRERLMPSRLTID